MDHDAFRVLLVDHLLPMIAGTDLGKTRPSSPRQDLVSFESPIALLMKPSRDANYRVQLVRSQAFTPEEKRLVELFIQELEEIARNTDAAHLSDFMSAIPRGVISTSQTYEGHPVVAALGMSGSVGHGSIKLEELWREDFSRVISNGFDSIYLCGSDGRVFNVDYLPNPPSVQFAPHRLGSIADWCRGQRVAIVLNRNGEVLIFKDKKLQFAKRRGAWRYYAHDSVVKRLGVGNASLRRAVYESCLDVSFARTGGCVAVLNQTGRAKVSKMIDDKDLIERGEQTRTKLLRQIVKKSFQRLDRRLRQELLSMDGATVLTRKGKVLTAGSIVRVPGGSTGGGRKAAAMQLSKLGLAIKISADGPITGFKKKEIIFSL